MQVKKWCIIFDLLIFVQYLSHFSFKRFCHALRYSCMYKYISTDSLVT